MTNLLIKETKQKFINIIKYINSNPNINVELPLDVHLHLKILIELWKNNKCKEANNINYYYNMKNHHSYINGRITDKNLDDLWLDYIKSGQKFRIMSSILLKI